MSSLVEKQKLEEDLVKDKSKTLEQRLNEYRENQGDKLSPESEKKLSENSEGVFILAASNKYFLAQW